MIECGCAAHFLHFFQHISVEVHDFPLAIASRMRSLHHTNVPNKRSLFSLFIWLLSVFLSIQPFRSNFNLPYFPHSILLPKRNQIEQKFSLWMSALYMRESVVASLQHSFIYRFNCHLPTHPSNAKQTNKQNEQKSRERVALARLLYHLI